VVSPVLPNPSTWSSNEQVLAPTLRSDVSNTVELLTRRPLFQAQNTAGTTIASGGSPTAIPLAAEVIDTWNGHLSNVDSSSYYCQFAGWYFVYGVLQYTNTVATLGDFVASLSGLSGGVAYGPRYGNLAQSESALWVGPVCADLIELSVTGGVGGSGDYVQLSGFQNSGTSRALLTGATNASFMTARWVCGTTGTVVATVPPLTAWAVPPNDVTSAFMNANIRDTVRFLCYPPTCRAVYVAGSTTQPSQTFPATTVVNLNTVTFDNFSAFTTGASGGYTAPVAGVYHIYGQLNLGNITGSSGALGAGLQVNGGTVQFGDIMQVVSTTSGGGATVHKRLRLNANDFVQLVATQNTGSAVNYNTGSADQTIFVIFWEAS
jgi:hypothetical protein